MKADLAAQSSAIHPKLTVTAGASRQPGIAKIGLCHLLSYELECIIHSYFARMSDTGTGMPPDVLEKVFEPFYTTKEVGNGSGLGLSMVYGFVKQSMGHITITSEVDHGTSVELYMPRSQEGATETGAKDDAVEFARGSERILVVEDDSKGRKVPAARFREPNLQSSFFTVDTVFARRLAKAIPLVLARRGHHTDFWQPNMVSPSYSDHRSCTNSGNLHRDLPTKLRQQEAV